MDAVSTSSRERLVKELRIRATFWNPNWEPLRIPFSDWLLRNSHRRGPRFQEGEDVVHDQRFYWAHGPPAAQNLFKVSAGCCSTRR